MPDGESVIGQQSRASAVSRLRGNKNRVDRVRLHLQFPPQACGPAGFVGGVAAFEHDAFYAHVARLSDQWWQVAPHYREGGRREAYLAFGVEGVDAGFKQGAAAFQREL